MLGWTYYAISKYRLEDTAINRSVKAHAFQWPVLNICPMYLDPPRNNFSASFEEMEAEIDKTLKSYFVVMNRKNVTVDTPK